MNSLFIWTALAAAFAVMLVVLAAGTAWARAVARKSSGTGHRAGKGGIAAFSGICLAALAVCLAGTGITACRYGSYGAFYDDSWKEPDVESHFLFRSDDTEALQAIYDSDPDGFRPALYDVLIVRLGCEDCEAQAGRVLAAKDEIAERKGRPAYIIFSRSEIGRLYVDEYGVSEVPVAIVGGALIRLYDEAGD